MKVLCCYTNLHPKTFDALQKYAPGFEIEYVGNIEKDLDNEYAYWREVKKRWDGTDDLMIVEHDIEINETVIPTFNSCPNQWCTFGYPVMDKKTWLGAGLGCVRFTARLQREVTASLIESKYKACWNCEPKRIGEFSLQDVLTHGRSVKPVKPGCWRHLDLEIVGCCLAAGYESCIHGSVVHHSGDLDQVEVVADFSKMEKIDIRQWDKGMPPFVEVDA